MKKCLECDSELTGEESFCPICGILLTPAVVPDAEPESQAVEELESTIMMPPEEIERLAGLSASDETNASEVPNTIETNDPFEVSQSVIIPDPVPPAEAIEQDLAAPVPTPEMPLADPYEEVIDEILNDDVPVPTPQLLSSEPNTSDDPLSGITSDHGSIKTSGDLSEDVKNEIEASSAAEAAFSVSDPFEQAEEPPAENLQLEEEVSSTTSAGTPIPEPMDFPEEDNPYIVSEAQTLPDPNHSLKAEPPVESVHVLSEATSEAEVEEANGEQKAVPEAESVVTGPDDGEAYTSPAEERDLSPAVETAEDDEPATKLWSGRDSLSNIVVETESGGVEEIASGHAATDEKDEVEQIMRPEEELEAHDPFSSGAMYDSVQIMEPDVLRAARHDESFSVPERADVAGSGTGEAESATSGHTGSNTVNNIGENDTDGRKSAKLKPLPEGTILNGRYEVLRKIGGGGMGAVYLASDNNLGGVLRAVKEMVQAHIEDEQQEKAINDFKRESTILSTLDHPSIPTIFDYFFDETENRFYLVMKYISGGDLASRLRSAPEGRLDERTVTEWALQVADVLDYLHNQPSPIVYRDLKPSNIMVDGNSGRVMLIDFGIARSISQREEKGVTAVGTMGYAPPELFSGNVEPRSDIYSLGSTMFHLLTGADPQSNPLLIFDFQKNPRPRQINSQLSDQMERILMRAVEYTADARFSSAAEFKQVLADHLAAIDARGISFGVSEAPSAVSLANQTVFCGFCGQRIVATDLFCAFCGSKQPIAHEGVHSGSYSGAAMTAKLYVEGTGELAPPTFSLVKDENLVGRRDPMSNIFPEIDLSRFDPQTKISRRHARIWRNGGTFLVEDLGSSNGTVIATPTLSSTHLVPHKPHALANGDRIKIGDTTLHFMIG